LLVSEHSRGVGEKKMVALYDHRHDIIAVFMGDGRRVAQDIAHNTLNAGVKVAVVGMRALDEYRRARSSDCSFMVHD